MKEKLNWNIVFIGVLVVLIGIFTFVEFPLAEVIYNPESGFGRFFEIIGTLPLPIVGLFSTVSLIMTAERRFCPKTILSYVLGIICYSLFFMYGVKCIAHQVPAFEKPMMFLSLLWTVACVFLVYRVIKKGKLQELRRASIIGVAGCLAASVLIGMIKSFFARPRYYTYAGEPEKFSYWFEVHPANKLNDGFPSGHSGQAAVSLFTILLSSFLEVKNVEKFDRVMTVLSIGFTICVMVSRMILGMHFATDVIMGAALPLIAMKLTKTVLDKVSETQEEYMIGEPDQKAYQNYHSRDVM
ncbi:MAG: phosphatase PAP2 family protein [Lachnospiraceae bacterium]|nr:phosphatase PAP2 family protein [Lachnospiraceae bacterium]